MKDPLKLVLLAARELLAEFTDRWVRGDPELKGPVPHDPFVVLDQLRLHLCDVEEGTPLPAGDLADQLGGDPSKWTTPPALQAVVEFDSKIDDLGDTEVKWIAKPVEMSFAREPEILPPAAPVKFREFL